MRTKRLISFVLTVLMLVTLMPTATIPSLGAEQSNTRSFVNPVTGSVQGNGNDHAGVDIFAEVGTPVYAVSSGYILYSEAGHTIDYGHNEDTKNSVKIEMDEPIEMDGKVYTNTFYTHLSRLVYEVNDQQPETATSAKPGTIHVEAGDLIGYSGIGRGVAHLHISFEWVDVNNGNNWRHMTTNEVISVIGWSRGEQIVAEPNAATFDPIWPCESAWYITTNYFYYNKGAVTRHATKSNNSIADGYLNAIDISGGGNILATEAGTVTEAGWSNSGFGNYVIIKHSNGLYSLYGHLSSSSVSKGDYVSKGQTIGVMGTTGTSSGVHLHFELYGIASNGYYTVTSPFRTYFEEKYRFNIKIGTNSKAAAEIVLNQNWAYTTSGGTITPSANAKETLQWYVNLLNTYYTKQSGGWYYSDNSVIHTHSYSITEYEAAHPHKAYTRCPCGQIGGYTGATTYVSSCSLCNEVCTCSTSYAGTYICTTTKDPLIIRTGHNGEHSGYTIPSGAEVTVTKADGTWAHVEYNGVSGCASMEYLVKKGSSGTTVTVDTAYSAFTPFRCSSQVGKITDIYETATSTTPMSSHWIDKADACTIHEIYTNGMCKITYPGSNGNVTYYTKASYFVDGTFGILTATQSGTAYWYYIEENCGSVDVGDKCLVIGSSGDYYKVICPWSGNADNSPYRLVWTLKKTFEKAYADKTEITNVSVNGSSVTVNWKAVANATHYDIYLVQDPWDWTAIKYSCIGWTDGTSKTFYNVADGYYQAFVITRPNDDQTQSEWMPFTVHTHAPGPAATCTTAQTCTVCGEIIVPATGHTYNAGEYTDTSHPHKIYNTCKCGAKEDTGRTARVSSCTKCYPAPTVSGITYTPSTVKVGDTVTFTLNAAGATAYELSIGDGTNTLLSTGKSTKNTASYTFTAEGEYRVWGTAYNGETSALAQTIYVTVGAASVPVSGVTLNKTSATIDVGDKFTLNATVTPSNATNKSINWTSSNPSVATVVNGVVTGVNAGTVTITATTEDGGYRSSCIVEVNKALLNKPAISISDTKGVVGNTIKVPVSISNNPGIVSMTLEVTYDTNAFTLVGVNDTELLSGAMHSDVYASPYTLTWENDTSRVNFDVTGTLVELVFEINENAQVGSYLFEVKYPKDGIYNFDGDNIDFIMDGGICTIINYLLGDVNGDGEVTNKDRLLLSRYLAKWDGYDINKLVFNAADINGDGEITNRDRLLLSRHLAKWSGYENLYDFYNGGTK